MKILTLLTLVTVSLSSFAIEGSKLHTRHQKLIKKEIAEGCGLIGVASFKQVENIETPNRIDQGILNFDYFTSIEVNDEVNSYFAKVESHYFDEYDHEARDWGKYLVRTVECNKYYKLAYYNGVGRRFKIISL